MLLFAHVGITLGAATVISGVIDKRRENKSWLASLSKYLDIRFLLAGSILPDIIDKPVGWLFLKDLFSSGRIFSHTLLFLVLLAVIGAVLYKTKHQVWMLSLAVGTAFHLLLDGMWAIPGTLFWPLLGLHFSSRVVHGWLGWMFDVVFSNPAIYFAELIGLVLVSWFTLTVIGRKQVSRLLMTGWIS
jgi:inner membrane protein